MGNRAGFVSEDHHGVLAGLGLENVTDELCNGRLVAYEAQLRLARPAGQVAPREKNGLGIARQYRRQHEPVQVQIAKSI